MTEKKRVQPRLRAETIAIFNRLNQKCEQDRGRTYPAGEWIDDAIYEVGRNLKDILWEKVRENPPSEYVTEEDLEVVFAERENSSGREAFYITERSFQLLESEIIPAISEELECAVRMNFAISMVMRYFADHSEYFVKPKNEQEGGEQDA